MQNITHCTLINFHQILFGTIQNFAFFIFDNFLQQIFRPID